MSGFEPTELLTIYEVSFFDLKSKTRGIFGRATTPEGAAAMKESVLLRPSMRDPEIKTRLSLDPAKSIVQAPTGDPARKRSYE